jgi:23S rRNA pseudouridine2604 synthase
LGEQKKTWAKTEEKKQNKPLQKEKSKVIMRINKYLRDKGLASRREADKLVEAGLVFVNGKRAENGERVNEGDKVIVKGKQKSYQYFAYYKPRGLASRPSVISEWKKKGLYPIGRLDKESEGLLLLTNDGRFAREVLLDKAKYEKEYVVVVKEPLREGVVKILKSGMDTTAFGKLLPINSRILGKTKISIILNEGKRHQIRVMLNELNYTIVSLKRVRIGDIKLENLNPGETKNLTWH